MENGIVRFYKMGLYTIENLRLFLQVRFISQAAFDELTQPAPVESTSTSQSTSGSSSMSTSTSDSSSLSTSASTSDSSSVSASDSIANVE